MVSSRLLGSGLKDCSRLSFSLDLLLANVILHYLFTQHHLTVYLLVYVDDIIITGSSVDLIQQLTSQLNARFSLKQQGLLNYFLGIEVKTQPDNSLLLTQSKYVRDLLQKTNMH